VDLIDRSNSRTWSGHCQQKPNAHYKS